jgi:hypothetical protein
VVHRSGALRQLDRRLGLGLSHLSVSPFVIQDIDALAP